MRSPHRFPDTLATTRRIDLRRYQLSDASAVLSLIDRNRGRLIQNFPEIAHRLRTADEASAYVGAIDQQWRDGAGFVYGIWPAHAETLIGQLRVKNIDWNVPSAELSYFVDREWLRRGVATEAIRAVLREAFATCGFERVYVRVIAENRASVALARRLGLRHEGIQRTAFRCGLGELHDLHLFAVTDSDYRRAQGSSTLHQEAADGTRRTVSLRPGEYAINDPGTWHTADVAGPATAVFITAGLGTQHRPR